MNRIKHLLQLIVFLLKILGEAYMVVRYGDREEEVLKEKFEGQYAVAGATIIKGVLIFFALIFMLGIIAFFIYYLVQHFRGEPL